MTDPIATELKHIAAARSCKFHRGRFFVCLVSESGQVYSATSLDDSQVAALLAAHQRTAENMAPTTEVQ